MEQKASTSKQTYHSVNLTDKSLNTINNKKKFSDDLKITFHPEEKHSGLYDNQTFIVICDNTSDSSEEDSDEEGSNVPPASKRLRSVQKMNDSTSTDTPFPIAGTSKERYSAMKKRYDDINPDAEEVKNISNKVVLTKLYQPWEDLGSLYISPCCRNGQIECRNTHGKYSYYPQQEYDAEYLNKCFKTLNSEKATGFLENSILRSSYPVAHIVQYVLLKCMDRSEEDIMTDFFSLNTILERHTPCDASMQDYYKTILFDPVRCLNAPDGVFWWCIYKIEDFVNAIAQMKSMLTSSVSYSDTATSSHENQMKINSLKLTHLFRTLDFIIKIMEADLHMGLMKNLTNLSHYACGNRKPYIAMAFWVRNCDAGIINTQIRHIMKLYLKIFQLYQKTDYPNHFRRLISLIAGVTYASQRNADPPVFPNIRDNCREFASGFTYIMLPQSLTLSTVFEIIKALKPNWFQYLVCSYLLEILDGRSEYKSLKSLLKLLKDLDKKNEDFPSSEEMSTILLRESSDTFWEKGKICRKLFCKLAVLTPLAIVLQIKITGISRISRNLDQDVQSAANATFVQFNHPSLNEDYSEFKKLKELVQQKKRQTNKKRLVETLAFLCN